MNNVWDHRDIWRRHGKDFLIEVTRHSDKQSSLDQDLGIYAIEGPNRWAVYAYIYPKHPHFANFEGPRMWQDAATQLHFHGGPSLLEYPMYEGKVTSVKVGADYQHLHDERFARYGTLDEAREVFNDANELFEQLQRIATQSPARAAMKE